MGLLYNSAANNITVVAKKCGAGCLGIVAAKYNSDGILDDTFGTSGRLNAIYGNYRVMPPAGDNWEDINAASLLPDGSILLAGTYWDRPNYDASSYTYGGLLIKLRVDGSLDPSFGVGGKVITPTPASLFLEPADLVVQNNGKILVAGNYTNNHELGGGRIHADYNLYAKRYLSNGSLDSEFNGGGTALFSSHVITGSAEDSAGGSEVSIKKVVLQSDGKFILVGSKYTPSPSTDLLVRLDENGNLDETFGDRGKVFTQFSTVSQSLSNAYGAVMGADCKIVTVGQVTYTYDPFTADTRGDMTVARYLSGLESGCNSSSFPQIPEIIYTRPNKFPENDNPPDPKTLFPVNPQQLQNVNTIQQAPVVKPAPVQVAPVEKEPSLFQKMINYFK